MTKEELKRRVYQAIDQRVDEIITIGEDIRRAAELGFKEVRTARRWPGCSGRRRPPWWVPSTIARSATAPAAPTWVT